MPAIEYSLERKYITELEAKVLKKAADLKIIKAADLKNIYPGKASAEISRQIRNLSDKKMLISEQDSPRKYIICFNNNYLLRGIIRALGENGFLPSNE